MRVGVNGGSLERPLLDKYGWPSPEALSESALNAVHALEDVGFTNMKVSLKASDVHHAIDAYWLFAHQSNYPLHIGITEAGTAMTGAVNRRSGWDTCCHRASATRCVCRSRPIRSKRSRSALRFSSRSNCAIAASMSLPVRPAAGWKSTWCAWPMNWRRSSGHIKTPLNVSVLGCVVNGIGEGKEADIGIAGGEGKGILFKKGKLVRKVPIEELMDTLIHEVELLAKEKEAEANGEAAAAPSTEGWETLPGPDVDPRQRDPRPSISPESLISRIRTTGFALPDRVLCPGSLPRIRLQRLPSACIRSSLPPHHRI